MSIDMSMDIAKVYPWIYPWTYVGIYALIFRKALACLDSVGACHVEGDPHRVCNIVTKVSSAARCADHSRNQGAFTNTVRYEHVPYVKSGYTAI